MTWQSIQSLALRRRWWFLIPFFSAWAVAFSLSLLLPRRYQSQALMLVEQQTVPKAYVQPNVVFNAEMLLQNMAQRILSRSRLEQIVIKDDLYPRIQSTLGPEAAVRALRKDISITPAPLGGLPLDTQHDWTAFRIAYTGDSPSQARQVATQLTSSFIEENLKVTQQASDQTTSFLTQQLQQAQQAVARDEQRIQNFERRNLGTLPNQNQANLAVVLSLQSQLGDAQGALLRSQRQIAYDRNLLKQQHNYAAAAPLIERLNKLQLKLSDLRSRYTDAYPSIPQLQQEIAQLQTKLAQVEKTPDNSSPAEIQNTLAGMPSRNQIQSQLQAEQLIEAREQRQVAALRHSLQQYQFRLNQEPVRGNQLASLETQYQQDQGNAASLLMKLNSSKLATQLEQRQGGAQFRPVDSPSLPQQPVWPKPLQFSGFGLLAGLALGLAIAAAAEFRQDQIHSSLELAQLGLPPILSRIPPLHTTLDRVRRRTLRSVEWAAMVVMLGAIVLGNYLLIRH